MVSGIIDSFNETEGDQSSDNFEILANIYGGVGDIVNEINATRDVSVLYSHARNLEHAN